MHRRIYPWVFLLGGVLIGMVASGWISIQAQDRGRDRTGAPDDRPLEGNPAIPHPGLDRPDGAAHEPPFEGNPAPHPGAPAPSMTVPQPGPGGRASVQDVLLRPYQFAFERPTSLAKVCLHLKQTLGVPVVLDLAALDRQNVRPDDAVQLELDGVRLKTGLKLLLDQVDLTYRVVPEDNLLIITDRRGAEDPLDQIRDEIKALHRDLHEVRDSVDDIADALYAEEEGGPLVRKPTIIEEKPESNLPTPGAPPGEMKAPKLPEEKPGEVEHPRGSSTRPSRIPLSSRRRRSDGISHSTSTTRSRGAS